MKFLAKEKLSEHRYKTPEGYLICIDAILARTGKQEYLRDEVYNDGSNDVIEIDRPYEEVFSKETLTSFENKPITVEHPDVNLNSENYSDYAVGFARDIHKGNIDGEDVVLGDLVIQDQKTIEEIEDGEHVELSCGYDCDIDGDEGSLYQSHIRGNHIALCESGRAGIARIQDSKFNPDAVKQTSHIQPENGLIFLQSIANKNLFYIIGQHYAKKEGLASYATYDLHGQDYREFAKWLTNTGGWKEVSKKDVNTTSPMVDSKNYIESKLDDSFAEFETETSLNDLNTFDVDMLYKKLQDAEIYIDESQKPLLGNYTLDELTKMLRYINEFKQSQGIDQYDDQVQLDMMLAKKNIKRKVGWIKDSKEIGEKEIMLEDESVKVISRKEVQTIFKKYADKIIRAMKQHEAEFAKIYSDFYEGRYHGRYKITFKPEIWTIHINNINNGIREGEINSVIYFYVNIENEKGKSIYTRTCDLERINRFVERLGYKYLDLNPETVKINDYRGKIEMDSINAMENPIYVYTKLTINGDYKNAKIIDDDHLLKLIKDKQMNDSFASNVYSKLKQECQGFIKDIKMQTFKRTFANTYFNAIFECTLNQDIPLSSVDKYIDNYSKKLRYIINTILKPESAFYMFPEKYPSINSDSHYYPSNPHGHHDERYVDSVDNISKVLKTCLKNNTNLIIEVKEKEVK